MQRYNNYHKHTHYSNLRSLDCISKPEDYIKRAVELGHTTYFTTEHGYQGNIYEAQTLCEKYGLKCIYGVEAYCVDDMYDKSSRANYHIILIAMNDNGRKEINKIMSLANTDGFYYKPRIDLKCLLSLTPTDVVITSACIAGRMFKGDKWKENFFIPVHNHFKNNFYLEVQCHDDIYQARYNKMLLDVRKEYGVKIIHANDSHYIFPEDAKYRDLFLNAKGIHYEEESNFILDYPDYDTIIDRYKKQGVLNDEEIEEALNSTLIFDNAEPIHIDKEFKIPKIKENILKDELHNSNLDYSDDNLVLREIIKRAWSKEKGNVRAKKIPEYQKAIYYETDIVEKCGMARYFILDHIIVKRAVEKYGAILTRSGRGSAVSFYINKLLELTEVDRIKAPIKLYPTRFMSAERILSSRSLPDIDLNFADVEPVIKASKDILGDDGIYYMIAYKPLQRSSAFRLWCKAKGYNINEYDEIAKSLGEKDYSDEQFKKDYPKWANELEESKNFRGIIESVAPSPCSFLLLDKPISEEVGLIKVGDVICCALDGYNCDVYKYLKNDYLTVKVYDIIDKVYKLIGRPIDDISTLINNCDDKVWDIYANGLTTTINQSDSDFGKQTLKRYKPKSLAEMSAWVAAIRPAFASLLNNFLDRLPYSTGVEQLDDILKDSFHYLLYQESIMAFLVWLGEEEKFTYDIIKKISKKKFKEEELVELKGKLINEWIEKVGSEKGFNETWAVVEDASRYAFNASHSLSVAIDSIYGAYLKSHYPLEYFTVVLTLYADDMARTSNLISELPYFNITLKPIKFGKSGAVYTIDKENNAIYKGVSSVKYLNSQIADELMELSKNKYNSFIDLLGDIKEKTSVNSKQLRILISLNFFDMFGENKSLLQMADIYDKLSSVKVISKNKLEELGLSEYLMKKYAGKETKSQYREIDNQGLIFELCNNIKDESLGIVEQIKSDLEFLEYTDYKNPSISEYYYIVISFKTYNGDSTRPYFTLRNIKTGEEINTKIKQSKIYREKPFGCFSILDIHGFTYKYKKKMVDDKWIDTEETEPILESYEVIKQ